MKLINPKFVFLFQESQSGKINSRMMYYTVSRNAASCSKIKMK